MARKGKKIKLSRDKDHKKALFRNLISALILHGSIKTTEAKAKAVRGLVDRIVNKAKREGRRTRDQVTEFLTSQAAASKLYEEIVPRFKSKNSGFTRIVDFGRRQGDNAKVVVMEWAGEPQKTESDAKKPQTAKS